MDSIPGNCGMREHAYLAIAEFIELRQLGFWRRTSRGCICEYRWINRWVWVLDPNNEIQLKRIIVFGLKYPNF